jgi:hypothetical protein
MSTLLALALVAICVAGCGGGSERGPYYVLRNLYCSYEYESRAEIRTCLHDVTAKLVILSQTPAAKFAKEMGKANCGRDAGPFCADAKREAEEP